MNKKVSLIFILFLFGVNLWSFAKPNNTALVANFTFDNACVFEPVYFTDLSTGNITNWTWNFDNGVGYSDEQDPEFTFSGVGVFRVELIISDGVEFDTLIREITIENAIPTLSDTVVCNNEIVEFNGNQYSEYVGTATVFNYSDTLVSSQGCDSISMLRMTVNPCGCELSFPNIFTPNGDGLNDTYAPVLICDLIVKNYLMIVYDRWGETVFESYDPKEAWDGKINGYLMPMDVFMIWAQYEIIDGEHKRVIKEVQDVTLIR